MPQVGDGEAGVRVEMGIDSDGEEEAIEEGQGHSRNQDCPRRKSWANTQEELGQHNTTYHLPSKS